MNNDATCRALQHLLVQGFTTYPYTAAVCTRLLLREVLDDPNHPWAVTFDARAQQLVSQMKEDDPLLPVFAEAALKSVSGGRHVVCATQGGTICVPLEVADVKSVRMRIEAAVAMRMSPPPERLSAYPDELIEQEAKRRRARTEVESARD